MPPSKTKSLRYLKTYILPRRLHDRESEKSYYETHKKHISMFRRVATDEKDRGEPYTVFNAGINTFGHFGIGVGIYFLQLLILCTVFFVSGMIMLAAVDAYKFTDYGLTHDDPLMTISPACPGTVNVTATVGCDDGETSCLIGKRENCNLPVHSAFADLIMSLFFMLSIYFARFGEKMIETRLDEAVQTAQNYFVEVSDPDPDEARRVV